MKLYKVVILLIVVMTITTGCRLNTDSAENLVKKPEFNVDNLALQNGLSKLLQPNTSFTLPSNSKDVGKINKVDLNNNGKEQIIAFKKLETLNEDASNRVGFMILSKDKNSYIFEDEELMNGDSIEYANFYDLNNDGHKEILCLVKKDDKTIMHIFEYRNNKIVEVKTVEPSWLGNPKDYSDMKITIGKLTKGQKNYDIIMANLNDKTNSIYISVLNFDGNNIINKGTTSISNAKDMKDVYMTIGNVTRYRRGIIVDVPTLKEDRFVTNVLYLDNGQLKKAFDDNLNQKIYYMEPKDINKDGVLEIPVNVSNDKSKDYTTVSWYRWNGNYDGRDFIKQVYYNFQYNFKMLIPKNIAGKIIVEKETNNDSKLSIYKFYYYYTNVLDRVNLFSIEVENKEDLKENKDVKLINIGDSVDYNYYLLINNIESTRELNLMPSIIKSYFSLIYK